MADARFKPYAAAAAVFALDRLTKWLVGARVSFTDTYKVIPGLFDIVHTENRGIAFGFFDDSNFEWRTVLLVAFSLAAIGIMGAFLWKGPQRLDRLSQFGFALIMGGAAGNVFDRMMWGRVTDFLLFYIGQHQWPAFNLADSAISVGSGLVMLDLLRTKRQAANVS
jgi:signal peptidase II